MYKVCGIGWVILLILAIGGCGGSDDAASGDEQVSTGGTGATDTAAPGTDGTGGTSSNTGTTGAGPKCGNGTKEGTEECDDGNKDDSDGCKSTCEFYCHKDAECSTDVCAGKSSVCDTKTGMCSKSGDGYADGTKCGDNSSCQKGACVAHQCGNTYKEGSEECDDGNKEDFDGCNTKCLFTCVKGDKKRGCANDCDWESVCDDSHKCSTAKPVADGALCNNGSGYCAKGQCVVTVCGDGEQSVNEECDKGEANSDKGECTKKCTLAVCGDGKIESKEQCDDGNTVNMDGCDSKCKVEMIYRGAQMRMSDIPAPDFCYYKAGSPHLKVTTSNGNTMGKLIASLKATMDNISASGTNLSDQMTDQAVTGSTMAFMFHVMDVDDPSLKSADPVITIGETSGTADNTGKEDGGLFNQVTNAQRLDWPFRFYKEHFDDAGLPVQKIKAEYLVEGDKTVFQSTVPATNGFRIEEQEYDGGTFPGGTFWLRNLKMRLENDKARSLINQDRLKTADWVLLPETAGGFDINAAASDYTQASTATGLMCGALDVTMFKDMPLPAPTRILGILQLSTTTLCPDQGDKVKGCDNGVDDLEAGKCKSMLDFLINGCTGSGLIEIAPLGEPDVDADGDGVGDAYTTVMKIAAQRITVSKNGWAEGKPMSTPIAEE